MTTPVLRGTLVSPHVPRTGGRTVAAKLKKRALLREVNTRIREISDRFGTPDGVYRLICECGREDCEERLIVAVSAYEAIRKRERFLIAPGHEEVETRGSAAKLVAALGPADPVRLR